MDNTSYLIELSKGSKQAFKVLFNLYSGKIYNFLLKISNNNLYLAEEITQRTFVKIWETKENIDITKSFSSYLCTIAKNLLLNEYQHQAIYKIYAECVIQNSEAKIENQESELDTIFLEEYIDRLIQKLPPGRRQIFLLSRKEMLSTKEIAAKLNLSESTISNQISKALLFMRENITKYYLYFFFFCFIIMLIK